MCLRCDLSKQKYKNIFLFICVKIVYINLNTDVQLNRIK